MTKRKKNVDRHDELHDKLVEGYIELLTESPTDIGTLKEIRGYLKDCGVLKNKGPSTDRQGRMASEVRAAEGSDDFPVFD